MEAGTTMDQAVLLVISLSQLLTLELLSQVMPSHSSMTMTRILHR